MENGQKENKFKNNLAKIIISILIIIVIGTIWFIKNANKQTTADNSIAPNSTAEEMKDVEEFSLHVTDEFDIEQLKSYGLPTIIDFGAETCTPCKEMAPVLEKLNSELQGKAIIKFVDVSKYPKIAENYPISVIPTQVFFDKDGKPYTPSDAQTSQMIIYSLKDTKEHVFTTHEGGMTEEMILAVLKEMGLEE